MLTLAPGCAGPAAEVAVELESPATDARGLDLQGRVMAMADDHLAALGEATYLMGREAPLSPEARWQAQSFLRNGVSATLDIGASPNPGVALLDLLVLASLQVWAFETHWIPESIGAAGAPALERLRRV